MVYFADMTDEERIRRLEHKVAEIRRMLFGALLLAKDLLADELSRRAEGIEIMKAMEKVEESFAKGAEPDRFKKFEHSIEVIDQRAKSIFDLMSYMSEHKRQLHSKMK